MKTIKTTFIINNKTEHFYNSLSEYKGYELFQWLKSNGIMPKIGNDTLNEKIDFNIAIKSGKQLSDYTLEPRKGYKLLTMFLNY